MSGNGLTRRSLLKFGDIATIGALGASALGGCAPAVVPEAESASSSSATQSDVPEFLWQPEPIAEFKETKEYDVVVVGAGESGLSAAHAALEAGAKVACVQNIGTAQPTGNMGASVDVTKTDAAGVEAAVAFLMEKNAYRSNRKLLQNRAKNSYVALTWWADTAAAREVVSNPYDSSKEYNGYTFYLRANTYNHVEGAHNAAALVIADQLAEDGVEFFYNSPAVQLQKDGDRVTGAICKNEDGSHTFYSASKGVILACGDCSGNEEMRNYYCPDLRGFKTMSPLRDGTGMVAGMWAGTQMTAINHSKMVYGGGTLTRLQVPFLNLDIHGERFMNEVLSFAYLNNLMRPYLAEFDYQNSMPANWLETASAWAEESPEEVQIAVSNGKAPSEDQFVSGNTIEELAANINKYMEEEEWGIDPIDEAAVVASVEACNELCKTGVDS